MQQLTQVKGSIMRAWQRYRGDVRGWGAKGDGVTDDTAAIQKAIDSGKSLLIPEGRYLVKQTLGLKPNQTVTGIGDNSIVLASIASTTPVGVFAMRSGCKLDNFRIEPLSTDSTFTHPNDGFTDPDRNFNYDSKLVGVVTAENNQSGITITRMHVERMWRGLGLGNCNRVVVTNNTIKWIGVWQTQFYNVRDLIFANNTSIYGGAHGGVCASSTKKAIFANNIVIGSGTGINTGGSPDADYNAEEIVVVGNQVHARDCINLENGIEGATVTGNYCRVFRNRDLVGTTGVGIGATSDSSGGNAAGLISNITITGNTIVAFGENVAFGVRASSMATNYNHKLEQFVINDNNIIGANFGIAVGSRPNTTKMRYVNVSNNTIKQATKAINVTNTKNGIVSNNIAVQGGIRPLNGYFGVVIELTSEVSVSGNTLSGFGNAGSVDATSDGIELFDNKITAHAEGGRGAGFDIDTANESHFIEGSTVVTADNNRLYTPSTFVYYEPATAHTINGLLGGIRKVGSVVSVKFNGRTTIQDSNSIQLKGGTSVQPPENGILTFSVSESNKLIEVSRSF